MSPTAYDEWLGRTTRRRVSAPRDHGGPRHRRGRVIRLAAATVGVVFSTVFVGGTANATWSIVGTDPATGQVGAAVASCVDSTDLTTTMALVPKVGGGVSVGQAPGSTPAYLAAALRSGKDPAQVLATIRHPDVDGGYELRQYGVAMLGTGSAATTGSGAPTPAAAKRSADGTASVQGNVLASPAVVTRAASAYDHASGPLAARLLAALKAGSVAGGDRSCGATARSAALVVVGSQSAAFVPAATATGTSPSDLAEAGDLTPAQLAERVRQQALRPMPSGPRAPDVYVSTIVPAGSDAIASVEDRYDALVASAASRAAAARAQQVIDPAWSQGLTIAAIALFALLGLILATLIIAGLRRADRRAAQARALESEGGVPLRKPYRGEVAKLFDVDEAVTRRGRREADLRRRGADRSRDSMWTSSTW